MTVTEDIWEDPAIGFSPAQQLLVPSFRDWLRQHSLSFARVLAELKNENPSILVESLAMEELEQSIENEFETLRKAHHALILLGKFVAYVNRLGKGPIPQPRIPRLVSKPDNPFAHGIEESLKRTRAWLNVEREWIKECADGPPIELVVFSAILHGGLLHQSTLIQLARTLLIAPEQAISLTGNRVSIDLHLPWHGVTGAEHRRWYPDDQTVALIRRPQAQKTRGSEDLGAMSDEELERSLLRKVRQRIRFCRLVNVWVPGSWKQLLGTVATAARVEVPPVLIEYATRRIVSHSLKSGTLQRIFGLPEMTATRADPEDAEADVVDSEDHQTFAEPSTEQEPDWLCFLRRAFREKNTQALRMKLESQANAISEVSSPGHCITRFALYLLTQRHRNPNWIVRRKPLKPNSVRSLTITVGRRFGCILGEQNPIDLTTENLETLYTQVLENVVEGKDPKRLRGTVACALREFQDFLFLHCDGPSINVREILGCGRGLLPVDSKIITVEQYSEARRILKFYSDDVLEWMDSDVRHAAEAMLILGFRCGTRRMEAHGLEVDDLTDRSSPWLWIRPTEARQLKTSNAKRQLPLHETLIPKDELEVLYTWKEKRIRWGVSSECPYLFALQEPTANGANVQCQIPGHKLISLIHRALRRATDDHTVHYHHLRHSFATWNFLRLMLSDLQHPPVLFPGRVETTAWMKSGKDFRKDLYGTTHPTRKHAMAIASLLGHSGPNVSMEHYVHCMDWLLNAYLSQSKLLRVPSTYRTILASGSPGSTLYKRYKDPDACPISVHLMRTEFPSLIHGAHSANDRVASGAALVGTHTIWVQKTWNLLFRCNRSKDPLNSLAEELGFDPTRAQQILGRAMKIQSITSARGKKSHVHGMKDILAEQENMAEGCYAPYPEIPRGKGDKEVIRDWEGRFVNIQPELLRSALGYYVNYAWKTENLLVFHDPAKPEDAIRYLAFLKALNVEDNLLRFVSFRDQKCERSVSRRQWINALGITWRWKGGFKFRKPPFGESAASKRWLGIEFSLDSKLHGTDRRGTNGFRFLMVMAAITFGYDGDEQS